MLAGRKVRRVDVVINRLARHLVADGGLRLDLVRAAREGGARVHETRSITELDAVAREIAARGTDCVVLAGGDGSYMAGVTALCRACRGVPPPVAFAPGGTVSTVARNWGMHGLARTYAARVVRGACSGDVRAERRPTLAVVDSSGHEAVGFIFGTGLVANFFDAYYGGGRLGYAGAAAIVARVFAGSFVGGGLASRVLSPMACRLAVDGTIHSAEAWSLVAASVVKNLGLHMQVLYRAGEDSSRIHVVASPLGPRALGPQLPLVLMGRRLLGHGHVDTLARELCVTFTTSRDVYVLDGEVLHAREVTVRAGPTIVHLTA